MNKVQNCPLCGSKTRVVVSGFKDIKPRIDHIEYGCIFTDLNCSLDIWNLIRIAPGPNKVRYWPDMENGGEACFYESWMSPKYPKEAKNGTTK